MLPTLIDIRFDTPFAQWVLYLVAVLLFGYGIWAGWRNAPGSVDRKTGKELPPTKEQRTQRAVIYGVLFGVLIDFGLHYALPSSAFLGSKGEGFPLHTYGLMLMAGSRPRSGVGAARRAGVGRRRGHPPSQRRDGPGGLGGHRRDSRGRRSSSSSSPRRTFWMRWGAAICGRCSARWVAGSSSTGG